MEEGGGELRERAGGEDAVSSGLVAFLRDAGLAIAAVGGTPARLWLVGADARGLTVRGRRVAGAASIVAPALCGPTASGHGVWLLASTDDGDALLQLDPATGELAARVRFEGARATAFAIHGDAAVVATLVADRPGLALVDLPRGVVRDALPLPRGRGALLDLTILRASDVAPLLAASAPSAAETSADETREPLRGLRIDVVPRVAPEQVLALAALTFPPIDRRWQLRPPAGELVAAVARVGGEPIGAVLAEVAVDGTVEILAWRVLRRWRRRGIGTAVLRALESGLRARAVRGLWLEHRSDWRSHARILAILRGLGWEPPRLRSTLHRIRADAFAASPVARLGRRSLPPACELAPWYDLAPSLRAAVEARADTPGWHPAALAPERPGAPSPHPASLALRRGDEVLGWCVLRALAADRVEVSALFVHEALQGRGTALALLAATAERAIAGGVATAVFTVAAENLRMRSFVTRRLAPYLDGLADVLVSIRRLDAAART